LGGEKKEKLNPSKQMKFVKREGGQKMRKKEGVIMAQICLLKIKKKRTTVKKIAKKKSQKGGKGGRIAPTQIKRPEPSWGACKEVS